MTANTTKKLRTCSKGHQFYKTSDCPVCPVCEQERKPTTGFLSLLSAPARRALENNGINTLKQLSKFTEKEISAFHGMGKSSLPILRDALKTAHLSFKNDSGLQQKKITTVDEYIAAFPKATQKLLQQMRATIKKAAPTAEEIISYAMPAFKLNGKHLVYFAGYENHIGFYATPTGHAAFKEALSHYKTGKGSVQFPINEPLPLTLIKKIVLFRVNENLKKAKI